MVLSLRPDQFNYSACACASRSYVIMADVRQCYILTSVPQEQVAKSNMVSVVRIQVFSIIHS